MVVELQYIRQGHLIKDREGNTTDHKTINAAKRWSREHQKRNGGLGMGSVRVAGHEPPDQLSAIAARVLNKMKPKEAPKIQERWSSGKIREEAGRLAVQWKMRDDER